MSPLWIYLAVCSEGEYSTGVGHFLFGAPGSIIFRRWQPEHIDFNHKSILIINPKNKKQRYVYFSSKLSAELKSWLKYKDRYVESPYVFPTRRGTQLEVRNYEKVLRDAGRRAGVEVHPHQLRNNFAKYYIKRRRLVHSLKNFRTFQRWSNTEGVLRF